MTRSGIVLALTLIGAATGCSVAPAEPTMAPNAAVVRTVTGRLGCSLMKTGQGCGEDRWTLTVQSDGSRTQRAYVNLPGEGSQLNTVYRSTGEFRFVEAFENAWHRGKPVGSGFYVADGTELRMFTTGPAGLASEAVVLPARFSVLLHPVSLDGWHFGQYDQIRGGAQEITVYTFGAGGGAKLAPHAMTLQFVGRERITVPAGRFETDHYRFGDKTEVWITGADRIMVRHEFRTMDTRFELTDLQTSQ